MKRCFKCGDEKPIDGFYKHPGMKDGVLGKCKECTKQDAKERRNGPRREYVLAYDRARGQLQHRKDAQNAYNKTAQGAAAHKRSSHNYANKHPEKRRAHTAVSNAIRDGKLTKQPCIVCGEKSEAHHPDYSSPLDVVWLCTSHHKQVHAMVRNEVRT